MLPLDYRWEHAVNTKELLDKVRKQLHSASVTGFIANDFVNGIEADIIWSESKQLPVMGHPPQEDSELTLSSFLKTMSEWAILFVRFGGYSSDSVATPIIVKLDFKSMRAFHASLPLLEPFISAFPFIRSIFINADILVGPANTSSILFDPNEFLALASTLAKDSNKVVLSVGWTTSNENEEEWTRNYTEAMVSDMIRVLTPYRQYQITFPLRATNFQGSWDVIKPLLRQPTWGITLWWAKTRLTTSQMEWLYQTLECEEFANRTFYDILGFDEFLEKQKAAM